MNVSIELPDEFEKSLDDQTRSAGEADLASYVLALLDADRERLEQRELESVPAALSVTSKAELEAKLLEGLDSGPPIPATKQFWSDLRAEFLPRHQERNRTRLAE